MKALVTGAGGFCGRYLTKLLQSEGIEVHTVGPRSTGRHHHVARIDDPGALVDVVRDCRPDFVFHLAGVTQALKFEEHYEVNLFYAVRLLQALEAGGCAGVPVLLAGTAAEYGITAPEKIPIKEDAPTNPINHYGLSKLAQTLYGLDLCRSGRRIVMARAFNIIGPGMPQRLSVQSFARQVAEISQGNREPVLEVGNLNSIRDFIDVRDVVEIYWRLIRADRAYGRVVNVCSGAGTRMRDLVDCLVEISGMNIKVKVDPARFRPDDIPASYGDATALNILTGGMSPLSLDETLADILSSQVDGE